MSSDTTAPTGTVTRCGWPACPSSFTTAPMAPGWTKADPGVQGYHIVLCPFHATGHLPHIATTAEAAMVAACSCRMMIPCARDNAADALLDWRRHAREVNAADELVTCQECGRELEPIASGLTRRHNIWDKMSGQLLAGTCFGSGLPPREKVRA